MQIILRCYVDNNKSFEFLSKIYEKQSMWAVGSDINKINDSIKIITQIGLEKIKWINVLKVKNSR